MLKISGYFVTILIVTTLILGCNSEQTDSNKMNITLEQLQQILERSGQIDRQEPFVEREFLPFDSGSLANYQAIAYGCYRKGQAPGQIGPSEMEILEDLKIISQHWHLIRVYGSDDDTERILKVIDSSNLNIKVMLGIWLQPETNNPDSNKNNIEQVMRGIDLANRYKDIVTAVSVGNETQVFWSWHKMKSENLIRYLRAVRSQVEVPVTTADDFNYWNKDESILIANELDFIVTHMHPLWNGQTLDESINWVDSIFNDIKSNHPQKQIVIGETGWATDYDPTKTGNGEQGTLVKGEVSVAAQTQFLVLLDAWIKNNKVTTFIFEAFDEPWKGGGENSNPNDIEKHWGLYYENREKK